MRYVALARLNTFKSHTARLVHGKIFQNCTARNAVAARLTSLVRTQVFSSPTTVLIQEVGILIRILFVTQL